ncbi:MAG: polysaccharide deacetylase family protein [Labilithrix sp.]|nr:polysaccharide deacetylase family protein [Labilithrix sp.]MCW5812165.1 polysaccharide deacetylase family protein [Labilithrix sp.]
MFDVPRVGAAFVLVALGVGCQSSSAKPSHACSEAQALQSAKMRGNGLPPKTISLTFDDGPGVRTVELSHWLRDQGVRVAFFVNGKNVPAGAEGEAVLRAIVDDGHVLGNHTETHADLTKLTPEAIVDEVARTDAIIAPFVPDQRFMFRPPYGAWNDAVLAALDASPMSKYVGPVDWDLGFQWGPGMAADWDCWSPNGASDPPVVDVATCGDLYLQQIRAAGSGVVLLHDPYFIDDKKENGGTVDMVMNIVPVLKAEGFTFVRVDEVPSLAAVLPPLATPVADAGSDGATSSSSSTSSSASSSSSTGGAAIDAPTASASGGSSDPCSSSPQTRATNH